jgi:hypothetical protein
MRLDQLEPEERRVLEYGAVEGEIFHRGGVQALSLDGHVTPRLAALVRKGLVRPDRAQVPGDEAFRFHHLLIRDVAYDTMPKGVRADLHQRFAAWLEAHGQTLVEGDELLGYHLEQAARYLEELGRESSALALVAGDRLGAAGHRAYWRSDWRTASGLLERALSLTRPYRLDLRIEVELVQGLVWTDVTRAVAVADAVADRATAGGDDADAPRRRSLRSRASYRPVLDRQLEGPPGRRCLTRSRNDTTPPLHIWHALTLTANMRERWEDSARASENGNAARPPRRPPRHMGLGGRRSRLGHDRERGTQPSTPSCRLARPHGSLATRVVTAML